MLIQNKPHYTFLFSWPRQPIPKPSEILNLRRWVKEKFNGQMKSGMLQLQRGRDSLPFCGWEFQIKRCREGLFVSHFQNREVKWERWSPIDLKVRHPLGSHWIHAHFEWYQELMQLLPESSSLIALFSHPSPF